MSFPKKYLFNGIEFEQFGDPLGAGAQGTALKVRRSNNPNILAVVKALPNDAIIRERTRHIVDLGIGYHHPLISAPLAIQKDTQNLYYLTTFCAGVPIEQDIARPLPELLMIAYLMVCQWERLEAQGLAHGDISLNNVLISPDRSPHLIDTDNYVTTHSAISRPLMLGQHPMMAPEIRKSQSSNVPVLPNLNSDRFAWAVLLSYFLFGRHPASWVQGGPKQFDRVMSAGTWPEHKRKPKSGTPVRVLSAELITLFERGFSKDQRVRPAASEWKSTIRSAIQSLHVHQCGGPFVHETTRKQCPWCRKKIPPLQLTQSSNSRFVLKATNLDSTTSTEILLPDQEFTYLGRNNLPDASAHVSAKHLELYRAGKTLYVRHIGRNPTQVGFGKTELPSRLSSLSVELGATRKENIQLKIGDSKFSIEY